MIPSQKQNSIRLLISVAVLVVLTSAHHAYGAFVYQTPWRLHTLPINFIIFFVVSGFIFYSHKNLPWGRGARVLAVGLILLTWLGWVGLYEGFYNHLIKDCLYFLGFSPAVMNTMFPSPMYEMPNNLIFELTGILQLLPLPYIAIYSFKCLRDSKNIKGN